MFVNKKSSASEILNSMSDSLLSKIADIETLKIKKLATALEHLNAAAEIFDSVGLNSEAEIATKLLEKTAQAQQNDLVKQKLMQALQPAMAQEIKWNRFQIAHDPDGIELDGEFELSPQADAAISAAMPLVGGKPMLFANYLSMLAKKVVPGVLRAQFVKYVPVKQ